VIGLVIVTHGRLAEELHHAMEHVVGVQPGVVAICIGADDDCASRALDVQHAVEAVDEGDGVVLLTDMFGGTPSNLCIAQMVRSGIEVLGGVNLPMLVKLAKVRRTATLPEAVTIAQMAGRKYIAAASDVLPHCRDLRPGDCAPVKRIAEGVATGTVTPNGVTSVARQGEATPGQVRTVSFAQAIAG
jgi:PTS system mannose-specific IIA component